MNSPVYDVLVVAHVLSAVVGFGALAATGSFAARARRADDPRASATLRNYFRPGRNWAGRVLFLVPLLGAALLAAGDHEGVGEVWPWIGLGLWIVAAYFATSRVWPAEREIQRLLGESLPDAQRRGGGTPPPPPATLSRATGTPAAVAPRLTAGHGDARALTSACRRAERGAALASVCFVAALAVMIVQPH